MFHIFIKGHDKKLIVFLSSFVFSNICDSSLLLSDSARRN